MKNFIKSLFKKPFIELVYQAQTVHQQHFNSSAIQLSTLLSVKTGSCSEDCAYCPQSSHYQTGLNKTSWTTVDEAIQSAKKAKSMGATRFCISASGKKPSDDELERYIKMIKEIKALGLSVCATLGELNEKQVNALALAGLDFYNHNIDTSTDYYHHIITTRRLNDRIKTLSYLAHSSIHICCGVIVGMGEGVEDRADMLLTLLQLEKTPRVIPINRLIKISGTPLEKAENIDDLDYIKMIAVTRLVFPKTIIALAAGRNEMSDTMQAFCFMAGANAMHIGEKLLVTPLPGEDKDRRLLAKLGLTAKELIE